MFQSLSRDSMGSDKATSSPAPTASAFQSLSRDSMGSDEKDMGPATYGHVVSIPQSGFYGFRRGGGGGVPTNNRSFNPSVGILWVQTQMVPTGASSGFCVSIPQSGFYGFRLIADLLEVCDNMVSIPQSGFYGFRRKRIVRLPFTVFSFNPSVGILWVQTNTASGSYALSGKFQSLSRDSMGSDCKRFNLRS